MGPTWIPHKHSSSNFKQALLLALCQCKLAGGASLCFDRQWALHVSGTRWGRLFLHSVDHSRLFSLSLTKQLECYTVTQQARNSVRSNGAYLVYVIRRYNGSLRIHILLERIPKYFFLMYSRTKHVSCRKISWCEHSNQICKENKI